MEIRTAVIRFYFPLENPSLQAHFEATVVIGEGEYTVLDFRALGDTNTELFLTKGPDWPKMILLPVMEDEHEKDHHLKWVHKDSGKETLMSESIGKALECSLCGQLSGGELHACQP